MAVRAALKSAESDGGLEALRTEMLPGFSADADRRRAAERAKAALEVRDAAGRMPVHPCTYAHAPMHVCPCTAHAHAVYADASSLHATTNTCANARTQVSRLQADERAKRAALRDEKAAEELRQHRASVAERRRSIGLPLPGVDVPTPGALM